jgi:hypothetical protein
MGKEDAEIAGQPDHVHFGGSCMVRGELHVTIMASRDFPDTGNNLLNFGQNNTIHL